MDNLLYILFGLLVGGAAAALVGSFFWKLKSVPRHKLEDAQQALAKVREALGAELATLKANLGAALGSLEEYRSELGGVKDERRELSDQLHAAVRELATARETNKGLQEKLEVQKKEIEALGKKISLEFEHIASRILDEKSAKFTRQNKDNLELLLKPLGENIENFRKKVDEVYDKEAKERFSLGREVQKLVELNKLVSEEASNLANALKGNAKIQGDWGQMILENILEQSGLGRDREYFVQAYLKDGDGNYLKNEEGKRMQPDVVIKYPDDRNVIIDSKVSLTAYSRYVAAVDHADRERALKEHILSIRRHVEDLSRKQYQDYAPSLDFVMMFVPVEPAYLLALQQDKELWSDAYRKRILLISPTNLIAALKLIEDLWQREYQNRNAVEIADRGGVLYDKFVGFVENLSNIGAHLDKAQKSYDSAYGQLTEGRGNLIGQAEKLRNLGVKAKKQLPSKMIDEAEDGDPEEESA